MWTKIEIKFRCKHELNGEWVYGDYFNNHDIGANSDFIINHDEISGTGKEYFVDRQFLGQFTGLKDKIGKDIYEGDIIDIPNGIGRFVILRHLYGFGYYNQIDSKEYITPCYWEDGKVIGNIHDSPELLKIMKSKNEKN